MDLLGRLPSLPLAARTETVELLVRSPSRGVRERAVRVGAATLPDEKLIAFLRSDADAVLRNNALEMLKLRGPRSFALAVALLRDADPDVVLQAVLLLDHINDPRAMEPLHGALAHDDVNVVQAAIAAMGHLGDARAIPDLLTFLGGESWLQMAAVQALGDLRSPKAVGPLTELLPDLMVGAVAAESLARIGGRRAFLALVRHWLRFQQDLDAELSLGFLAHVLEGLRTGATVPRELRPALAARLSDPAPGVRAAAAGCLLALGAGAEDAAALRELAEERTEHTSLPTCLARRHDLIGELLARPGILRSWGFLLARRFPRATPLPALAAALAAIDTPEPLEPALAALAAVRQSELAAPILEFYLRLAPGERAALAPVLAAHARGLRSELERRSDLRPEDRLVLGALLGETARSTALGIAALSSAGRREVVAQIVERPAVLRLLPWEKWLEEEPEAHATLAAQAAIGSGLRELLPALRGLLARIPNADLVRAAGELGDRESLPELLELLENGPQHLSPLVVDSLGKIGGPEARRALRNGAETGNPKLSRIAYKALATCATEEDDAFFRDAIAHSDWYVRLAAADVLGRFVRPGNLAALTQLAADPVRLVAERALAALES